ncbi:hypothetical protein BKA66DRAFT_411069 [Pyrenochaeta sp. MPI-SDFR-AT-0127]|nr:hypothetical protein BKA66DRAFT_411069 [Pyrenochaeta sp. MPI-SDFR-AT-0127]
MRADLWLSALLGAANASAMVGRRDAGSEIASVDEYPPKDEYPKEYPKDEYPEDEYPKDEYHHKDEYPEKHEKPWKPKTNHPEFFSLKVDEKCWGWALGQGDRRGGGRWDCRFDNYAIRLEKGIVIATPYNKWWDPKLPIFFVSKKPLQLYIDTVTGSLRYTKVGWLPPDSVALSFYKTGTNPLQQVGPSPAHLSWPSTQGLVDSAINDPWWLCPLGGTGQYQIFVSKDNYGKTGPSGVYKDSGECKKRSLAAINANPWKKGGKHPW